MWSPANNLIYSLGSQVWDNDHCHRTEIRAEEKQEKERDFPGYGHSSLLLNLTPPIPNMFIKNFPNALTHFTFSIQQEIHFIDEKNWGNSLEPCSFKAEEQRSKIKISFSFIHFFIHKVSIAQAALILTILLRLA